MQQAQSRRVRRRSTAGKGFENPEYIHWQITTSCIKMTSTKEISPKLRKTIDRLQSRIKENADYEVHQEIKAIANR
jgi:hypothetical protein